MIKEAREQLQLFRTKLKQNSELIAKLKRDSQKFDESDYAEIRTFTILTKEDWNNFKKQFNKVYPNYYYLLRETYPQLSRSELRYLCLVKLNLSQSEIASALAVSDSTIRVTWHRIRKKLKIDKTKTPEEFLKRFEKLDKQSSMQTEKPQN
ncbi:helix-turn-helix transcriptional regulator [Sinomicrobium sp.]